MEKSDLKAVGKSSGAFCVGSPACQIRFTPEQQLARAKAEETDCGPTGGDMSAYSGKIPTDEDYVASLG